MFFSTWSETCSPWWLLCQRARKHQRQGKGLSVQSIASKLFESVNQHSGFNVRVPSSEKKRTNIGRFEGFRELRSMGRLISHQCIKVTKIRRIDTRWSSSRPTWQLRFTVTATICPTIKGSSDGLNDDISIGRQTNDSTIIVNHRR